MLSTPRDDPKNPKSAITDLGFRLKFEMPTSLGEVRQSGKFADWGLVRQSRLSTIEAPLEFVEWMRARYPGVKI